MGEELKRLSKRVVPFVGIRLQEILAPNLIFPTLAPRAKLTPRRSASQMHLTVTVQYLV